MTLESGQSDSFSHVNVKGLIMIITKLEYLDNKKVKIYIDDEYAFLLYTSDIKRNKLQEDSELTQELYVDILEHTIYRRAKQKTIAILKYMDRTEQELRQRLLHEAYPQMIVDRTLDFVKEYGYVDDERYATTYVRFKKNSKSKYQIQNFLYQKGISKDLMNTILETEYDSEEAAIIKAIKKKTNKTENLDPLAKNKLIASLCRKGFRYDEIVKHL